MSTDNNLFPPHTIPPIQLDRPLKILAIGNSFSVDAMEYLWSICHAGGIGEPILGNLYIGGCSLQTHWKNIQEATPGYIYYKNTDGIWNSRPKTALLQALTDEQWDVITLQQSSGSSGIPSTYLPLKNILSFIEANKTNPNAQIWWHMTWAYQHDSPHKDFPDYNYNQKIMYQCIAETVQSSVIKTNRFSGLIPAGTAIQNLRASYIGDILTRDGYHLSFDYGRYTAALTWFAALGGSPEAAEWVPADYSYLARDLTVIHEAVRMAVEQPLESKAPRTKRRRYGR